MVDQGRLDTCAQAFPGIQNADHNYSYDKLLQDSQTQGKLWDKQTEIARNDNRVATSSPDTIVGHAMAAQICAKDFGFDDQEKRDVAAKTALTNEAHEIASKAANTVAKWKCRWFAFLQCT